MILFLLIAAALFLANEGGGPASGIQSLLGDSEDPYFRRCADAEAAGNGRMREGDPGYALHLDRDRDGIACEWN